MTRLKSRPAGGTYWGTYCPLGPSVEQVGRFPVNRVLGEYFAQNQSRPLPAQRRLAWLLLSVTCRRERILATLAAVRRPTPNP